MADFSLPPVDADRNMILGVLALQLDFLGRTDLRDAIEVWAADRSRPLAQVLVERQVLAPRRASLLERLVDEYLIQHDLDPARGLVAACAARALPVDIEGITGRIARSNLATLPAAPCTLSTSGHDGAAASVGVTTSSGLRFRILRSHARGALGEVFVAVDEELHREVALKEIQPPYARNPDSRARFVLEAEITGSLEHPGIVPVYGLGAYPDGRPFYAMRFIKGDSLHEAISSFHMADDPARDPGERALSLHGLLRRFVVVCEAVAYAHSRGVVHRDIKPANILLGAYGETLLVDWGLAKVHNRPWTKDSKEVPVQPVSTTAQATMLGQAVGTPAFMSPEQAAGKVDQVGAASDVYSLGATLYTLLTGIPPYPWPDANEVIRQVQLHNFLPPRKVKRQVPADIEAVVLKAMAYHPADRYDSASELAGEIERWLADEPVRAYREPLPRRARRWARRHGALVSGVVALMLTTVVALGIGLHAVRRERDQARRNLKLAEDNLALAQKAVDRCFLLAKEEPLLQKDHMRPVRKLLLEQALPFYLGFQSQKPDDTGIRKDLARNLFRVAFIHDEIGRKDEAVERYEQARAQFLRLSNDDPDEEDYRIDLGQTCHNLAAALKEVGRREAALEHYEEARQIRAVLAQANLDRAELQADLAETLNNQGELLAQAGRTDEALTSYREAIAIQRKLVGKVKDRARYQAGLAAALHNLAMLLAEQKKPGAARAYEEARDLRERVVAALPDTAQHRAYLAETLNNLASLQSETGKRPEARKSYDRACELLARLAAEFPEVAEYRNDLAETRGNLGMLLRDMDEPGPALALVRDAHEIQEAVAKEHSEVVRYQLNLAWLRINLGDLLRDADRCDEALKWYARAVGVLDKVKKREPGVNLRKLLHRGRARTLDQQKRYAEAAAEWTVALALASGDDQADARLRRATSLARAARHEEAMKDVAALKKSRALTDNRLYELACAASLSSRAAQRDTRLGPQQRSRLAEQYGAAAVALLERARQAGVFRDVELVEHLKKDRDLDAIRNRDDFRKFQKSLPSNQ
jgi:serine/threonine-protein kinase